MPLQSTRPNWTAPWEQEENSGGNACRSKSPSTDNSAQITFPGTSYDELDVFDMPLCTGDEAMPQYLMGILPPEDRSERPASISTDYSLQSGYAQLPIMDASNEHMPKTPRISPVPPARVEAVDALSQLGGVQLRLAQLMSTLSSSLNTSQVIEDLRSISDVLISTLNQSGSFNVAYSWPSVSINGAAVMLFCSCYFSFMQTCEYLTNMLTLELQGSRISQPSHHSYGETLCRSPQCEARHDNICWSADASRSTTPRHAIAEMNLRLVYQVFQGLKDGMKQVDSYFPSGEVFVPKDGIPKTGSSWGSSYVQSDPLVQLVDNAMCDLRQREENLLRLLGVGNYSFA
ncbi:hypothetical protein QQS21_000829 [Conoideocrella luteorostrata]|uniref:Uncharacterized protein n=1 Tax=Conoideocrella luteorostrata TaxID=1105319 RepID=A0AAJ0D0K3_9HYPO|nr:hypothetical protein QQS21_000829 [Conoideocrella luteorostrata]